MALGPSFQGGEVGGFRGTCCAAPSNVPWQPNDRRLAPKTADLPSLKRDRRPETSVEAPANAGCDVPAREQRAHREPLRIPHPPVPIDVAILARVSPTRDRVKVEMLGFERICHPMLTTIAAILGHRLHPGHGFGPLTQRIENVRWHPREVRPQ
jgi:hypothetical protein